MRTLNSLKNDLRHIAEQHYHNSNQFTKHLVIKKKNKRAFKLPDNNPQIDFKNKYILNNLAFNVISNTAKANNMYPFFLTLTLDSPYHMFKTIKNSKGMIFNDKFKFKDTKNPFKFVKDGYKELNTVWRDIYHNFSITIDNKVVKLETKFIKVFEIHKNLTPHLHAVIWIESQEHKELFISHVHKLLSSNENLGRFDLRDLNTHLLFNYKNISSNEITESYQKHNLRKKNKVNIKDFKAPVENITAYLLKYISKGFNQDVDKKGGKKGGKGDLMLLKGWLKQNNIRPFSHSKLETVSKEVFKKVWSNLDKKVKEQLLKETKEDKNILEVLEEKLLIEKSLTYQEDNHRKDKFINNPQNSQLQFWLHKERYQRVRRTLKEDYEKELEELYYREQTKEIERGDRKRLDYSFRKFKRKHIKELIRKKDFKNIIEEQTYSYRLLNYKAYSERYLIFQKSYIEVGSEKLAPFDYKQSINLSDLNPNFTFFEDCIIPTHSKTQKDIKKELNIIKELAEIEKGDRKLLIKTQIGTKILIIDTKMKVSDGFEKAHITASTHLAFSRTREKAPAKKQLSFDDEKERELKSKFKSDTSYQLHLALKKLKSNESEENIYILKEEKHNPKDFFTKNLHFYRNFCC